MKIKTLLFGAGPGACQYIENTSDKRLFLGFIDNNVNKQGDLYNGLPVYSPNDLGDLEYEQIVITTQWALEVEKQLVQGLNVSPEKVVLPNKNQLKKVTPFFHIETRELARHIIKSLNAVAVDISVPLVVDFGTLLGIVRDGDVIEWDDDVDFAVPDEYADKAANLLNKFIAVQCDDLIWKLEKVTCNQGELVGFLLKFIDPDKRMTSFVTSVSLRKYHKGVWLHMPSLGMWYAPKSHFEQVQLINWQGECIQVPNEFREYLTFQYGDWKTPKRDMQLSDYAHLNEIPFEQVKEAAIKSELLGGSN
jgi:hypothetical protein